VIIAREKKPHSLNRNKIIFIGGIISEIHQVPRKQNNAHSKTVNV
jgi:hypothetical protein